MRVVFYAAAMLIIAAPVGARPAAIKSAYTRLDLDRCSELKRVNESESGSWRCPGFAGVSLFVQTGDARYDVDAGREDRDQFWDNNFDYPGPTVEWRLAGGKPFAIIYRLNSAGDAPKSSRLLVEGIGRSAPGCRVASIDGRLPDANAQARRAADQILGGDARCLGTR